MKFLADENLDAQIVEELRREGHQVLYVVEMEPGISFHRYHRQSRSDSQAGNMTSKFYFSIFHVPGDRPKWQMRNI